MRLHEQQLSSVADRDSGCGYIFVVLLACTCSDRNTFNCAMTSSEECSDVPPYEVRLIYETI